MEQEVKLFCSIEKVSPQTDRAVITIPSLFVESLVNHAAKAQQKKVHVPGFGQGLAPLNYIKTHYKTHLHEYVKQFLFKYFVVDELYNQIKEKKLNVAGDPRLESAEILNENNQALFVFQLSPVEPIDFKEWKHFAFKAPRRKKYKDIDRQVDTFIEEEQKALKEYQSNGISTGDWVNFECAVYDETECPLFKEHKQPLWIKIGDEEADHENGSLFSRKQRGDSFITDQGALHDYFYHELSPDYKFKITVNDVIPYSYFSFDDFRRHFRLKTQKDLHQKLIEVFSFRNDLSQRRTMVEETFKLLFSKHRFEVPNHIILRQQEQVIHELQMNPDYPVYKTERQFENFVKMLALKQAREMILVDQIAHHENIQITNEDIHGYLNCLNRPRTKEFVYFQLPSTKVNGQEMPIPQELLKNYCSREKTLNHIIYNLNKK